MNQKTTQKLVTRAELDRLNAKHGFTRAAADDPIYSEGPSIHLSFPTPRSLQAKGIVSLPHDSD